MRKVIQDRVPNDGREWDCQCARCGSSVSFEHCDCCGEDDCYICDGFGGWRVCLSSVKFCHENPLPGRESVRCGEIEWFTFDDELEDMLQAAAQEALGG